MAELQTVIQGEKGRPSDRAVQVVRFLDMNMTTGSFEGVAGWVIDNCVVERSEPLLLVHLNLYNYYLLSRLGGSSEPVGPTVYFFDGIGMKLGARLAGLGWLPDLNGTDLFPLAMSAAEARDVAVYLLGAGPDDLERVAATCRRRFPNIRIVGSSAGYFSLAEEDDVVETIRYSGAALLVVSRGAMNQLRFLDERRGELGVRVIWNVGGLFDFLSGRKRRAPRALRRLRLEWLFRFVLEPKRMWRRNLIAPAWFVPYVVFHRLRRHTASPPTTLGVPWQRVPPTGSTSSTARSIV